MPRIRDNTLPATQDTAANYAQHEHSDDPIDLVTGAFLYSHDDLTTGAGALPLGLGFQSAYLSASRLSDGPLGLGWRHNFDLTARSDSDTFQGLGEDSPVDAAAAIAASFVALDILKGNQSKERLVIAALIERWYMDQLLGNTVLVSQPGQTQLFVQLPDGSYNPPPGAADKLLRKGNGTYRLTTKQGVQLDFNSQGRIATWRDPNGNTLQFGCVFRPNQPPGPT